MITIETIYYVVAIVGILCGAAYKLDTKMVRMQESNRLAKGISVTF